MTKTKINIFVIVALLVFSIGLASASVTCDVSQIILTNTHTSDSFTCFNSGVNNISVSSNGYFTLSPSSINANSSQSFSINSNSPPSGYSPGLISFATEHFIPVNITMPATVVQTGCQINPSLVSYQQAIQTGTTIPLPKITFNPVDCPGTLVLTASSVSIQGGIIASSGVQKPISISSVVSDGINLNIDTTGLSSQTYSSTVNINAFSKTFQIPFTIIITSGTSPVSNFSCSSLPTCTLTATQLNLNSTYALTCSNMNPDIKVIPDVDTNYIQGTNVNLGSSTYAWYFKPISFGNTNISASFTYLDSPVCGKFNQQVRISSSGASSGTNLGLIFTPTLDKAKPTEDVTIQVIDSTSNSIRLDAQVQIDAKDLNTSNGATHFKFDLGKNYSLRAISNGYNDLVKIVYLTSQPISINITPSSGDSNTVFNITTNIENASLVIDGITVSNPYLSILSAGVHDIMAVKEGYIDTRMNFTVDTALTSTLSTEFKKGTPQSITLSKNATWTMFYQSDSVAQQEPVLSGNGTIVTITPSKSGIYTLQSEGRVIGTWSTPTWDGKWFGIKWYIIIGIVAVIVLIIYFSSSSSSSYPSTFGGNINAPQ